LNSVEGLSAAIHVLVLISPLLFEIQELIALGEAVGTESKGLSVQAISALPGSSYVPVQQDGSNDQEQ
jgi:E3 ubiquitin-protein ligase BIG BROTHER-like protein